MRVLTEWTPPLSGYHLYYPSRRQASPAFKLLVEAFTISTEGREMTAKRFMSKLPETLNRKKPMRIGILGSGLIGGRLGTVFARAGHDVVFSYSRDSEKLKQLAKKAGANARTGSPAEAVHGADVVLLAVHWTRVDDVLAKAGNLAGKALITCSLPMRTDIPQFLVRRFHSWNCAYNFASSS
jgi:hypothetical protein